MSRHSLEILRSHFCSEPSPARRVHLRLVASDRSRERPKAIARIGSWSFALDVTFARVNVAPSLDWCSQRRPSPFRGLDAGGDCAERLVRR